jgi:hypothetical protein
MNVQKRNAPFCPPPNAAILYCNGRVELEYDDTYSTLKSLVTKAWSRASTAIMMQPNTAYAA